MLQEEGENKGTKEDSFFFFSNVETDVHKLTFSNYSWGQQESKSISFALQIST